MGGGGSDSPSIGDIGDLVERAKRALRERQETGRRNVFISFALEDLNEVNLLRGQARNDNVPIEFNDWSISDPINSEKAPYIKQKISDRISQCSVTVVYLSDNATQSSWVGWEIAESIRQGKEVIGVYPGQTKPQNLPEAVRTHGLQCVPWSKLAETIAELGQ